MDIANNNDFVYLSLIGFSITLIQLCIHALIFVDKLANCSLNQEFLYSSQAV